LSSFTIRRVFAAAVAVSVSSLLLGGCSGTSLEGFAFGKANEPPKDDGNQFPAYYKQEVAAFMQTYLENPRRVRDAYIGAPVQRPVAGAPRYVTCVRYNPRNPDNKYEGNQERFVIFYAGKVTQVLDSNPQVCPGLAYQRYPEIESMVP
jgi:hypothetical protein